VTDPEIKNVGELGKWYRRVSLAGEMENYAKNISTNGDVLGRDRRPPAYVRNLLKTDI